MAIPDVGYCLCLKRRTVFERESSLPVEMCRLPRPRTRLSRRLELPRLLRLTAKSQSLDCPPQAGISGSRRRSGPNRRVTPGITRLNMLS